MTCTPVKFIDTVHYTEVSEWSYLDGGDDDNDDTKDTNKKCIDTYTLSIRKKESKKERKKERRKETKKERNNETNKQTNKQTNKGKKRKKRRILLPVQSSLAQISLQIPQCCTMQTTIKVAKLYNKSPHYHVKFNDPTATATNNSSFLDDITQSSKFNKTKWCYL
jgi:negative regulator of genetic competence, sporulation and motility